MFLKRPLAAAIVIALGVASSPSHADVTDDLRVQMEALQKQLDAVKAQLDQVKGQLEQQKQQQQAQAAAPASGAPFLERKPGDALTFLVPGGGEVTLYGNFDVSFDYTTKGLQSDYGDNGGMPVGKVGWQPAISTNLSYIGAKGKHPLARDLDFI